MTFRKYSKKKKRKNTKKSTQAKYIFSHPEMHRETKTKAEIQRKGKPSSRLDYKYSNKKHQPQILKNKPSFTLSNAPNTQRTIPQNHKPLKLSPRKKTTKPKQNTDEPLFRHVLRKNTLTQKEIRKERKRGIKNSPGGLRNSVDPQRLKSRWCEESLHLATDPSDSDLSCFLSLKKSFRSQGNGSGGIKTNPIAWAATENKT